MCIASIFHSTLNLNRVWLATANRSKNVDEMTVDETEVDETGVDGTGVDELGINLLKADFMC